METNSKIITNKENLELISDLFVEFLCDLLEATNLNKVNMVGIGNSISSGWTATDECPIPDVCPWVLKLENYLVNRCKASEIDMSLGSFAIAGENSNKNIYKFILKNPSLRDTRNRFEYTFDRWQEEFKGGLFENDVAKDIAMSYYPDSLTKIKDYYQDGELTITAFNGCTGEFLTRLEHGLFATRGFLKEELYYLKMIITYITRLSDHSYITIGNFPYMTRNYLFINNLIAYINRFIKQEAEDKKHVNTMYFDGMSMEFFNKYRGKLKLDNHPSTALLYNALGRYLLFLIETLPSQMLIQDVESLKGKYEETVDSYKIRLTNSR